jgi:hypothetical protein
LKQIPTTLTISAERLSDGIITASASSTTVVLPAINTPTPTTTATAPTPVQSTVTAASNNRSNLYGLPDFSTQIISVIPSNIVAGQTHYTAQFVITNIGTNVTPANWEFEALIPLTPVYTYYSPVQQRLYPGDKIVYTLGFDVPNTNYNNTQCNNYNYNTTTYPYNSYSNTYPYNTYTNCPTTSYPNYSSNYQGTFSVIADPQNIAQESNKANNTASVSVQL